MYENTSFPIDDTRSFRYFLAIRARARDKSGAAARPGKIFLSPVRSRRTHACPRPRTTCVVAPGRLSRLFFFTSKFPKPARQSTGDRTADVPPTMSSWALALHKRGNSKNDGARRDGTAATRGRGAKADGEKRERRGGFHDYRPRLRLVSKAPRAARADLTMHTFRVPLAFRPACPFASLRIWCPCLRPVLFPSFISPGDLPSFSFPAGSRRSPLAPRRAREAISGQTDGQFCQLYARTSRT